MKKYRLIAEFEAYQWWKNGDHPLDCSKTIFGYENGILSKVSPEERKQFGWEGDVVRYYRSPDITAETKCPRCGKTMREHGWIDNSDSEGVVCPGDWIIQDVNGEFFAVSDDQFSKYFKEIQEGQENKESSEDAKEFNKENDLIDPKFSIGTEYRVVDEIEYVLDYGLWVFKPEPYQEFTIKLIRLLGPLGVFETEKIESICINLIQYRSALVPRSYLCYNSCNYV